MGQAESRNLRALGARLALYVRNGDNPVSRAALQAVAADLAAGLPEIGPPLGDLVGRPGFRALLPLAGQGKGEVEREALIQDAARIYLPEVTAALREILNGFLEAPIRSYATPPGRVPEPAPRTRPASPTAPYTNPPSRGSRPNPPQVGMGGADRRDSPADTYSEPHPRAQPTERLHVAGRDTPGVGSYRYWDELQRCSSTRDPPIYCGYGDVLGATYLARATLQRSVCG